MVLALLAGMAPSEITTEDVGDHPDHDLLAYGAITAVGHVETDLYP
jgi:hypothetical protein